jgi:hypothetical protein
LTLFKLRDETPTIPPFDPALDHAGRDVLVRRDEGLAMIAQIAINPLQLLCVATFAIVVISVVVVLLVAAVGKRPRDDDHS